MNAYDIAHEKMVNALVEIAAAEVRWKNRHVLGSGTMKVQAARTFAAEVRAALDYSRDAWGGATEGTARDDNPAPPTISIPVDVAEIVSRAFIPKTFTEPTPNVVKAAASKFRNLIRAARS